LFSFKCPLGEDLRGEGSVDMRVDPSGRKVDFGYRRVTIDANFGSLKPDSARFRFIRHQQGGIIYACESQTPLEGGVTSLRR
jgi:hypothetical protein